MNPIEQALSSDYTEEQILNFISQRYPEITKKISKALKAGHSTKNILNFLRPLFSQFQSPSSIKASSPSDAYRQRRQEDIEANKKLMKLGAEAGLAVAGGTLAGRALKNAPNLVQKVGGLFGGAGISQSPQETAEAPIEEAMEGTEVQVPPPSPNISPGSIREDFDKLRLTPKIESLAATRSPEVLGGILDKQISPEEKQALEDKYGKPFGQLIKDYADFYLSKAEKKPLSREGLQSQFDREIANEEVPEVTQKLAILPDGKVGRIVEERQGIGSIETPDGQVRRRKLSEVDVESPEVEEFLSALKESIPEEERSTALAFASYNEPNKMMAIQFPNGDFYLYPEATPEQFKKIISNATLAKTTGETWRGVWTQGEGSRGAGMSEVLKELERDFGKNFIKFAVKGGYEYPLTTLIREIEKRIEKKRKQRK